MVENIRTDLPQSNSQLPQQGGAQASPAQHSASLVWLATLTVLLSFAGTLTVFILLYTRDLTKLSQLPEMVWSFLCGVPSDNGIILPVLTLLALASFSGSAIMIAWRIAQK